MGGREARKRRVWEHAGFPGKELRMEKNINYLKRRVLEAVGFDDVSGRFIEQVEGYNWLRVCTGQDGKEYVWYTDGIRQSCMCVETGTYVSDEVIKEQLQSNETN